MVAENNYAMPDKLEILPGFNSTKSVTKGGFDMSEKGELTLQIFYPRDRGSVYKRLKSDLAKHSYNTVTKFNKFIYENNN